MWLALQDDFCQLPLSGHSSMSPPALLHQLWYTRSSCSISLQLQDPHFKHSSEKAVWQQPWALHSLMHLLFLPFNQCVVTDFKCIGCKIKQEPSFLKRNANLLDNNKNLLPTDLLESIKNTGSHFYMSIIFLYNQIVIIEWSHFLNVVSFNCASQDIILFYYKSWPENTSCNLQTFGARYCINSHGVTMNVLCVSGHNLKNMCINRIAFDIVKSSTEKSEKCCS